MLMGGQLAVPGPSRKKVALRVVEGTQSPRSLKQMKARQVAEQESRLFGPMVMPDYLDKYGREAWKVYILPATWLTKAQEPVAILFCNLWSEFREKQRNFPVTKYGQIRRCLQELGLTDERFRNAVPDEAGEEDFYGN